MFRERSRVKVQSSRESNGGRTGSEISSPGSPRFLVLALFVCLRIGLQVVQKVLIMAAIAEISSLQEWEEEWKTLEEDTKKFKVLILYLK